MVEIRQLVWDPVLNKWIDQLIDEPASLTDASNLHMIQMVIGQVFREQLPKH